MSDKIDLAKIDEEASYHCSDEAMPVIAGDVLAFVRAVRAAIACQEYLGEQSREQYERQKRLADALAAFSDSARFAPMTKKEFLSLYGETKVAFVSYYKFVFAYEGTSDDGSHIQIECGGNAEAIHRMDVSTNEVAVKDLDPYFGKVSCDYGNGESKIVGFYEYSSEREDE